MPSRTTPAVPQMTVVELKQRLDRGKPLTILDVREDDEHAYCAIATSGLHIPMHQVRDRLNEIEAAWSAASLVVYCHHGMRSLSVATWLAQRGVGPIFNLEGGIDAWSLKIDPSVKRY